MATVYLAGPIEGTDRAAQVWRKNAAERFDVFGVKTIDPFDVEFEDYNSPMLNPRSILVRDHFHVANCDLLLANLVSADRVSIGTVMEIAWAYEAHIPIILVMEPDGCHDHPMLSSTAALILYGLAEAIDCAALILRDH